MVDYVQQDEEGTMWQFGVAPFDSLQHGQKPAVLAQVGCALLRDDEPAPNLTTVLEGTVAAIYGLARDMVQLEIDDAEIAGQGPTWRELVLAILSCSAGPTSLSRALGRPGFRPVVCFFVIAATFSLSSGCPLYRQL